MTSLVINLMQSILTEEAKMFRRRMRGPVIGITGSVGKTSTKELVGRIVRLKFGNEVFVSPKSLNNDLGVPLTILGFLDTPSGFGWVAALVRGMIMALFGLPPKAMVVEMGSDRKGDIAHLSAIVRPTIGIITNISESHTAFLGSIEGVAEEKLSLLRFIDNGGTFIQNLDDPRIAKAIVLSGINVITTSTKSSANVRAIRSKVEITGTSAALTINQHGFGLNLKHRLGDEHVANALLAIAVATALDAPINQCLRELANVPAVAGRGQIIPGKKQSYIIDSTYNCQPAAMVATLETLKKLKAKKKIVVLGDMLELADSERIHKSIGKLAHEVADYIIGVGPMSKNYKPDEWFATANEASDAVLRQLIPGAIVLVKGSQGIRLERVVRAIMQHPEQASKLLVRQSPRWLKKD